MNDTTFPWLTTLVVLPLVGAAAVWLLPGPTGGRRRLPRHACGRRACPRRVRRRRRRNRPADRAGRLDPRVRRQLRPRGERPRAEPDPAGPLPGPAGPAGRLARAPGGGRRRGGRRRRPADPQLRRPGPGARGVHGGRVRRARRLPVLRPVRGHADPGLLHDRRFRRAPAALRSREVPDLLPGRWPGHAGRRDRPVPAGSGRSGRLLFLSFFFAFAVKAPMWPVHTWLPDAAEQAPAGTNGLLVGVLDKVGTFGMLTLCLPLFPNAARWAAPVIIVLAVISILYGAFLAIGQEDLMRLIAYTSVSHFGFIVLGIFAFTSVSIQGSSLYMLTHGLSTGALFLVAGFLVRRWGTARVGDLGGLQKVVPVLAGTFLVAGLSALSLPGLAPFVSELLVFVGTFAAHGQVALGGEAVAHRSGEDPL